MTIFVRTLAVRLMGIKATFRVTKVAARQKNSLPLFMWMITNITSN